MGQSRGCICINVMMAIFSWNTKLKLISGLGMGWLSSKILYFIKQGYLQLQAAALFL